MRKIKHKKRLKIKNILLLIILIYFSFFLINNLNKNKNKFINKKNTIFFINNSYKNKTDYNYIFAKFLYFFTKIDFKKPETLLVYNNKLKKSNNVVKEEYSKDDIYNEDEYKKITSLILENDKEINDPVVYIYNSHQLETYSNEGYDNYNFTPNVMMVSYLLKDKLNSKKINTIVEQTNVSEFIKASNLPNEYYGATRIFITNARKKYPTLKYFIDIHRDSIPKDISTININDNNYARILFVLGTTNKTYYENEKVMNKLSDLTNKKYNKLSRGVFKRETKDWYEAYNQDIDKNVLLIEVGGKDNTMDEIFNTVDALSDILSTYIGENNE